MRRNLKALFAALILTSSFTSLALADGMLLLPTNLSEMFSEQSQLAVMEVKDNHTVVVNLFISLSDKSKKSHQVTFLLPLQTMPKTFNIKETNAERFRRDYIQEIDEIIMAARFQRNAAVSRIEKLRFESGLIVGPAAWGLFGWQTRFKRGPVGSALAAFPLATLSQRTEHAKVNIYQSLELDQLAALAKLPGLPSTVQQALMRYSDKPFALIQLRTWPKSVKSNDLEKSDAQPGVQFTFTQEWLLDNKSAARIYNFPLGTGKGWSNPIELTQVCVIAPDHLNLEFKSPNRPKIEQLIMHKSDALDSLISASANGKQVHSVAYWHDNPSKDISVRLNPGVSEFAREKALQPTKRTVAKIGFPLLALISWIVSYLIILRIGRDENEHHLWRAVKGWAMGQALLVVPAISLIEIEESRTIHPTNFPVGSSSQSIELLKLFYHSGEGAFLIFLAWVTVVALIIWRVRRKNLLWRSLAAGLIAGVIYVIFSNVMTNLLLN